MKEYLITSGFLNRQRKLILAEDYLEWENGNLKGKEFTRLTKSAIVDFKHGMDWIVWYKFRVGRQFSITLKDNKHKEIKVEFYTRFGMHEENDQKYSEIVHDIWSFYHDGIVSGYLEKFYRGERLEIQGIKLNNEGVELRDKIGFVSWDRVALKEYYNYFAIYHKDNSGIHSRVSYNEYGTETLWSAVKTILRNRESISDQ